MQMRLPMLDASMKQGLIVAWLKAEGDAVAEGEAILQVETDKAVTEVVAPATGVLRHILVGPGAKVPVGTVLGIIETN
jgi:pyruvate dehydrogenase E2 component (dihydrolipoamide acetyltransferase)